MNAVAQKCRPKHQVYILKCYPKYQKNATDVKPNSSELSYLLYYASTRRSKLQKVCKFLEQRTVSDVYRGRIGNVGVTLHILKALIEKCSRDLPLFATYVLAILREILKNKDFTLIEDSLSVFETFCEHQDPTTLAADQEYIRQYEDIVRQYTGFASKDAAAQSKTPVSVPQAIRYRKLGLEAVRAITVSDVLSSETARQLSVILPVILENLYSENPNYLTILQNRELAKEEAEKEALARRRQSTSTVRTHEEEPDPIAASGTIADADRLAEEEVGVLALQSLRHIFSGTNRGQLRLATTTVLKFVTNNPKIQGLFNRNAQVDHGQVEWPTALFELICKWTPVQDRFIIAVTVVEALVRSPIVEDDLPQQLVLAHIIGFLLSSSLNLIGLSVMDVMIGLINHILLLLQLGGDETKILPHHQQTDIPSSEKLPNEAGVGFEMEIVTNPSSTRKRLIRQLETCISDLATHVYYQDQISDMIFAMLNRLKPPTLSSASAAVNMVHDPVSSADAIISSAKLLERPNTDGYFSFDTAKIIGLTAVKNILLVANSRSSDTSNRNRVGVLVWEGTQWLLRDPSWEVRKAYVDALTTWAELEIKKTDLRVVEDRLSHSRQAKKEGDGKGSEPQNKLARRAVSNASKREKSPKEKDSTFLQLLKLAVYENAHQYSDSEADFLLLHLLLTTFVQKLGVNSVRTGLPMMVRLQEDIQDIENPFAKVRVGSLVHGYFWALSVHFAFEASKVGREVQSEIERRREKGLWLEGIKMPPLPLARITLPAATPITDKIPQFIVQSEALRPFDHRAALVDRIAEAYVVSISSPPSSPAGSPGRSFSVPAFTPSGPNYFEDRTQQQLPLKVKEQLMTDWTKETCIETIKVTSSRSVSLSGSRTGKHLGINGFGNGSVPTSGDTTIPSPSANPPIFSTSHLHQEHVHGSQRGRPPTAAYGLVGVIPGQPKGRRSSINGGSPTPISSSSARSTIRVDDLKRVLTGINTTPNSFLPLSRAGKGSDASSDSMVSANFSASELSFMAPPEDTGRRETTRGRIVEPGSPVPPVPPIPASLAGGSTGISAETSHVQFPVSAGPSRTAPGSVRGSTRRSRSMRRSNSQTRKSVRGQSQTREARPASSWSKAKEGRVDFSNLLNDIDVGDGVRQGGQGYTAKPPY